MTGTPEDVTKGILQVQWTSWDEALMEYREWVLVQTQSVIDSVTSASKSCDLDKIGIQSLRITTLGLTWAAVAATLACIAILVAGLGGSRKKGNKDDE